MQTRGAIFDMGVVLLVVSCLPGCSETPEPATPALFAPASADTIHFVYTTTSGDEISSATTRGRATAILFVTTYDLASQLVARRLDTVVRRHKPRCNALAVVLEPPKYAVMADAFGEALQLSYPVAMSDVWLPGQRGPFGAVDRVPTLVVLDRSGAEAFRHAGVVDEAEIGRALAAAEKRGFARLP